VVTGLGIAYYERNRHIPLRGRYFLGIVGESILYAVVVAFMVSTVVGWMFMMAPSSIVDQQPVWIRVALSVGAGLYEELLFRVVLVGGLYLLLRTFARPTPAYVIAALIGALIFSWVHYIGPFGDAFLWSSFTFRFLFGLVLNVIFLARGFAVAAWTHALYDVMVVTHMFG
jgi:membrane protease YdiL (CAAX protease family)